MNEADIEWLEQQDYSHREQANDAVNLTFATISNYSDPADLSDKQVLVLLDAIEIMQGLVK